MVTKPILPTAKLKGNITVVAATAVLLYGIVNSVKKEPTTTRILNEQHPAVIFHFI